MMAQNSSPRIERIAYQIWWLIQDSAGECTLQDMAEFTGASMRTCTQICRHRGWAGAYRKMVQAPAAESGPRMIEALDGELSALFGEAA